MLAVAGQTSEPNGLDFFKGTHRYPGSKIYAKKIQNLKKVPRTTPGTSARVL